MKPLFIIPIEPLVERYSDSWYRNFPALFANAGFAVTVINGEALTDEIRVGTFLDINSTVHYKATQLECIAGLFHAQKVEPGTVFFFSDCEFWGLEAVRLLADMNKVPIKMCGFLHAASYTKEDAFAIAEPYQQFTEVGWLACLDKVFVGSEYHKHAIIERRELSWRMYDIANKIVVTKNPLFLSDYAPHADVCKQQKMVLTNRFDSEKRPNETLDLFRRLHLVFQEWQFVVCTSRTTLRSNVPALEEYAHTLHKAGVIEIKEGLTKAEYHKELAEAAIMVSHSIEENYGYCIAEALLYGVLPLLRKGMSHDEFLHGSEHLWFDLSEDPDQDYYKASALMRSFDHGWPKVPTLDTSGAENILREVLQLSN